MTIYELAEHLKLSVSTTSKALNGYPDVNEKTRKRVIKAAQELSYEPSIAAQSITTKKSYLIGVVYKETTGEGLMHPHFSEILEWFKKEIEKSGYQLMFLGENAGASHRTLLQMSRYRALDGLLIMAADRYNPGIMELLETDIPVVLVDFEWNGKPSVLSDNTMGIRMIVEYLIAAGHRQFAYLAGPCDEHAFSLRKHGLQSTLQMHALTIQDDLICESQGIDFQSGYDTMRTLIPRLKNVTAVVGAYDSLMVGAMCCLRDHGIRVPEDISLTGFDNVLGDQMNYWQLTTVEQPRAQIGALAAKQLIRNIEEKICSGTSTLLPLRLVERASCKRLERSS